MSDTEVMTAFDPPENKTVTSEGSKLGARFAAMIEMLERSETSLFWMVGEAGRLTGSTLMILSAVPS
eukprot:870820-Rhodomonas_salina.1